MMLSLKMGPWERKQEWRCSFCGHLQRHNENSESLGIDEGIIGGQRKGKEKKSYKSRIWRRVEVRMGKRNAEGGPRALRTHWWLESVSFL